jgi:hypothetical protein
MLVKEDILNILDHSNDEIYSHFVQMSNPISYLIDSRLNVFGNGDNAWAVVIERLGFNPREDAICLQVYYYGNCLRNRDMYNGGLVNSIGVYPIDTNKFSSDESDSLNPGENYWEVRGKKIQISNNTLDYKKAGIELKQYVPGVIAVEEAARWLILEHHALLRATDEELYTCIPPDLSKILVVDAWYHKDFVLSHLPAVTEMQAGDAYAQMHPTVKQQVGPFKRLMRLIRINEKRVYNYDREQWAQNRPSTYETWHLIADVIVTGNANAYQPTKKPNTHWRFHPESGSM